MAFLSFDRGATLYGSTCIENMFLLEYLPTAQDDCLRVYLYARVLCAHPELGGSVGDIARALRMDEDAVEEAFRFWEREGLVKRLSDRPPAYALTPMRGARPVPDMDRDYYQFRDFNASLQRMFGDVILHGEVSIPQEWVTVFGFSCEAALRVVEYGVSQLRYSRKTPRATLRRLDNLAREWSERGARSLEDVERMIDEKNGDYAAAEAVLKRFGLRRRPTEDELALARKWRGAWGFDLEAIVEACKATTSAQNPSFAYVDRVLEGRYLQTDAHFEALRGVLRELGGGQQPTPDTLRRYAAFLGSGFEPRTVELAAVCLNARNRHRFEDLERLLAQWAEKGLTRADAAEAYVQRQRALEEELSALLSLAGSDRTPGISDIALYEGWKARFSEEMLRLAAELSREKGRAVAAMDRLLGEWEREGVTTPEQARARAQSRSGAPARENPALRYEQRPFAGEDSDLFTDLSQYRRDDA